MDSNWERGRGKGALGSILVKGKECRGSSGKLVQGQTPSTSAFTCSIMRNRAWSSLRGVEEACSSRAVLSRSSLDRGCMIPSSLMPEWTRG